ncbi:sodium/potassium-transporting ATPase subunit alpha [Drosophila montana]|uniref:sodium/potassium-transporting ATPase subunit alpha n=1 Tax=Drosophila montana TaxID=40370 RepID=UPI00313B1A1E
MDDNWKSTLHLGDIDRVCWRLQSSKSEGLSTTFAKKRLLLNGKNKFTLPERPESKLRKFLRNCFYGFGIILLISLIFCFILYHLRLQSPHEKSDPEYCIIGVLLSIIFLLSGLFRYLHDNDDYGVVAAFKDLMPMYCTVRRDGRKQIIRSEDVVLGDILLITYGERIAADVRFFVSRDLEVNNVALTGYSVPVIICPDHTHRDKWGSRNVGFACSHVIKGYGEGLVIACGNDSEVGIMARLSMEPRPSSRPRRHIKQVTFYTYIVSILMFFILLCTISLEGLTFQMLIEFNVSLTISLAPLYLPTLMYFGLWQTKRTLLESGCYVRNMEAASTLGLTTVICSSLIGTLTIRSWRVSELFADGELEKSEHLRGADLNERFLELIRASVVCNRAYVTPGQRGVPRMQKTLDGTDYEKALLKFAMRFYPSILQLRRRYERLANKPYDKVSHLQVSVHQTVDEDGEKTYHLFVRGYWSVVLRLSSNYYVKSELVELDDIRRDAIANIGMRLKKVGRHSYAFGSKVLSPDDQMLSLISIGFAYKEKKSFEKFMKLYCNSLCFLGLISIYNPPSINVRQAVDRCRSAGIKLVLLTRAELSFARAVAKTVGVIGQDSETIEDVAARLNIHESEVKRSMITAAAINMQNWQKKLHHQRWDTQQLLLAHVDLVFADIAVEQRHMIVDVCQQLGAVVTVIGSSVHDTSAIRRANVGVAECASSHASQSSADIILLEDNFVTLVNAIAESRLLFENMKKALAYAMSPNMAVIMVHLSFILIMIPFRLFLIILLLLDIFVNTLPALSLFYERPELDLMNMKPKVFDDYLINRRLIFVAYIQVGIVEASAVLISYLVYMAYNGFLPRQLMGLSVDWYDDSVNDLVDSYGQEWTREARRQLEYEISTVVLITLIIMQCVNLILTKTIRADLLKHGFGNVRLNIAVVYMICLGFLFTFLNCPDYLRTSPVNYSPVFWYILPLIVLNIFLETARRYVLRHFPGSWLEEEMLYGYL